MMYALSYDPETGAVLGKLKIQDRADFEAMEHVVEVVASTDPERYRVNPETGGLILLLPVDVPTVLPAAPAVLDLSSVPDGSHVVLMNEVLDRLAFDTPTEPVTLTDPGTYFVHVSAPVEYRNAEFWVEVPDA